MHVSLRGIAVMIVVALVAVWLSNNVAFIGRFTK